MNTRVNSSGINPQIQPDVSSDLSEIQGLGSVPLPLKARGFILPQEEALSLPEMQDPTTQNLAFLNNALGEDVTTGNPVWSGDPIPSMRGLQKTFIEFSLQLEEGDRSECMDAISMIEKAVRLRLRWQQMKRSDQEDPEQPAETAAAPAQPAARQNSNKPPRPPRTARPEGAGA